MRLRISESTQMIVNMLFKVLFLRTRLLVQYLSLKQRFEQTLRKEIKRTGQMTDSRLNDIAELDSEIEAKREELRRLQAIGIQVNFFIEGILGKIENGLQTERD